MEKKIKEAKKRIIKAVGKYPLNQVFAGHSGGKDSSVIHHLVNELFPDVKIMMIEPEFKNLKPMLKKIRKVSANQSRIELIHNYLRNINNVTSLKVKNGEFIEEK